MNTLDVMRENFLADIIEHPDDDTPRLIYADWLEDHGEPERGEFIRVQCEMARRRAGPAGPVPADSPWLQNDRCYQALYHRERELLDAAAIAGIWSPEMDGSYTWRRGFVHVVRCTCAAWLEHGPAIVRCQPVQRVELSDKSPIEYLSGLIGKFYWRWFDGSRRNDDNPSDQDADELPGVLWQAMVAEVKDWEFNTEAAAIDALSAACLRWAKEQPCR